MLIAAIVAPLVSIVAFFIFGFFFASAFQRNDTLMMKFWGTFLVMGLLLSVGSFWIYHLIDSGF